MRPFLSILALLALSLLAAAVVAYPLWLLVGFIDEQPIHRILHRVAMLAALFALIWFCRRWHLENKQSLGFGLPRPQFFRQIGVGLICGALIILPLMITLYLLGLREPKPEVVLTLGKLLTLIAGGLASGLVVALIEELFFRGILFTAIESASGSVAAIVLPSLLYASVHFLGGRLQVPADQIEWSSGFAVLERMFIQYNEPLIVADSFLALFAVGVLLALVRRYTGAIAACIGLHAAWVCAIFFVKETTRLDRAHEAAWLVGSYDGIIGWGAVGWMAAMAGLFIAISRARRRRTD